MNISPTSSSPSTSSYSSSSSSSSASNSTLHPNNFLSPAYRRRSVDTGGLNLAVNDHAGSGSGRGYGGWSDHIQAIPGPIDYAELVIAMREQTNTLIDQAYPAASTTFRPSSETDAQRTRFICNLSTWHFDASLLPSHEVLVYTNLLFELLWSIEGMEEDTGLAFETLPPFLARVSKIYREQTFYHNFQHALDVLQAMYCYLHQAGCIPGIEILLAQDHDLVTSLSQVDLGKGKAKAQPASDVTLPPPRRRRMWRKPRSSAHTLLQRALGNKDLFALFVAAIGHDIGHPGLSNTFMKNAKTPLSELFDDTSVLEKMHCTLLLQVMRKHRMGHLLDRLPSHSPHETRFSSLMQSRARTDSDPGVLSRDVTTVFSDQNGDDAEPPRASTPSTPLPARPILKKAASAYPGPPESISNGTGTEFRNLLMKTILATDMSVHFAWMPKLEALRKRIARDAESEDEDELGKAPEAVDYQTRLLLCQTLIKCADISNPSRPPPACKHWSWILHAEWTEQALLERQLSLPISVPASVDPIKEAVGQVDFITMFTLPLLSVTSMVIPEMAIFEEKCATNLSMWEAKAKELNSKAAADARLPPNSTPPVSVNSTPSQLAIPTSPPDLSTMFALSLPSTLYTPNSELRQPSWPVSDISTSPVSVTPRPDEEFPHVNEHVNGQIPFDLMSPSPPPIVVPATNSSHRRHTSHTELPQVSIPSGPPLSFSSSNSQHAKSSSTTSTSPLFSPLSVPTSSSSPRSDISAGSSSGPSAISNAVGLHLRSVLRAAYDAHGRPKAMKRLENRTSWQGTMTMSMSMSTSATNVSDSGTLTAPKPPRESATGS